MPVIQFGRQVDAFAFMDWYQVRVDKDSGIRNEPKERSAETRYVLDLLQGVLTVRIERRRLAGTLPELSV